jgi:hypothetical protein
MELGSGEGSGGFKGKGELNQMKGQINNAIIS